MGNIIGNNSERQFDKIYNQIKTFLLFINYETNVQFGLIFFKSMFNLGFK